MHTAQLLSEFAKELNRWGPDSREAEAFVQKYDDNKEFVELARLSSTLKRALTVGRLTPNSAPTEAT